MLFSIIAPTYNQIEFIENNIESVLNQSFDDFEYIVLDDCSTESYAFVVEKYINNPKFRYIRNSNNLGRVKNYQYATTIAKGDYIIICDGDDFFIDLNMLLKLSLIVKNHSPNLILSGMNVGENFEKSERIVSKFEEYLTYIDSDVYFFENINKITFSHFGCVFKRELSMDNNFYKLNILSSDIASIYSIIEKGKIVIIKESFGFWRRHISQISKQKKYSYLSIFNYLICWQYILKNNRKSSQIIKLIINDKYNNTVEKIRNIDSFWLKIFYFFILIMKFNKFTRFNLLTRFS